jgi:MoaA/NifB/PqqE/SkfB family radical SAM enzyme
MNNRRHDILKERIEKANLNKLSGPFSVAFTVTSKCNYRCRHCYNNSGDGIYEELSDIELLNIAEQIGELHPLNVCLCGGEPLVRGEVIYEVIRKLSAKCGIVNLVSNGYLITENVLERLKEAGINTIQVSLDGNSAFLHENMRLIPGAFDKAVNAIRLSAKYGFKVAVSFCPNKLSLYKIEDTCKLAKELGANDFRVMPLILMGRGKQMANLKPSADEYLWLEQKMKELGPKYQDANFTVSWGDPLDHLTRMPENSKNSMNTYSVEIRSDGKLLLCNYLPVVVGDLKKHSLKEYWYAGYNNIWGNESLKPYIENYYSTEQFCSFDPEPYTGKDVVYDLIDAL